MAEKFSATPSAMPTAWSRRTPWHAAADGQTDMPGERLAQRISRRSRQRQHASADNADSEYHEGQRPRPPPVVGEFAGGPVPALGSTGGRPRSLVSSTSCPACQKNWVRADCGAEHGDDRHQILRLKRQSRPNDGPGHLVPRSRRTPMQWSFDCNGGFLARTRRDFTCRRSWIQCTGSRRSMSRCRAIHLIIAELDEAADRGASLTAHLRSRLAALRHLGAMALGVLRVGLDLMTAPAAPDDQPMPVAELTQLLRRL
jgi:hypothetical protein